MDPLWVWEGVDSSHRKDNGEVEYKRTAVLDLDMTNIRSRLGYETGKHTEKSTRSLEQIVAWSILRKTWAHVKRQRQRQQTEKGRSVRSLY